MPYPVPEAERRTRGQFWNNLSQTWPARAANALYEAATLPGDVYAGRVDPTSDDAIRRSADLAGFAAGGGLTAALGRKGTSLGTFGGKTATRSRGKFTEYSVQNDPDLKMLTRRFEVGDYSGGRTFVGIKKNADNTVKTDFEFELDNVSTATMEGIKPAGREAMDVLATVMDEIGSFVEKVRPREVTFTAARPELEPLYRRVAQRLAKNFGGEFDERLFKSKGIVKIKLPNARKFQPWKKYGAPQGGKPWEKYERQ